MSWVVFNVGFSELTDSKSDLFKENAFFLFHLELLRTVSVSVASHSFINLLFIIIIFFVLGLIALLSLALTSCIYFFKFCFPLSTPSQELG